MNNQNNDWSLNQKPKRKPVRQSQNFVEALKSIGGYTAKSARQDLIEPTIKDVINTFTGGPVGTGNSAETPPSPDQWGNEWLRQKEEAEKAEAARRRHQEILATPVYDRQAEETKAQIEALRKELQALAKELGQMADSTQKAIDEEIAQPGTYHVAFFEKLRKFIINLRKSVVDSKNWLEESYARRAAQNVYWGNFSKSGTKFSMSSERSIATSAG